METIVSVIRVMGFTRAFGFKLLSIVERLQRGPVSRDKMQQDILKAC